MPFLSLVTLTFDIDIQTCPSKGPNMSSLWIQCKSVQQFPRYFIHKQKSHRQRPKQNLMQFTVCGNHQTRKDIIPNTNCMQVTERAEKCRFCPWWPWPSTFNLVRMRDQTCLPCESGANPFIGSGDISYTNKKTTDWWRQNQNLLQFTACGNKQISSLLIIC